MNLKNLWIFFLVAFVLLVPFKIYASLVGVVFAQSIIFTVAFGIVVGGVSLCACFSKPHIRNMAIKKNIILGILGVFISVAFFWCISTYFADTTKYDFEWQPVIMSVLSILSCVTFILKACTFFTGKNFLISVPFLIFCPVMWFSMAMILFLSISNNSVDLLEVALTAVLTLFFMYHTQVFSTSSQSNIVRLMYIFGIPSIILASVRCIPLLLEFIKDSSSVTPANASTCALELLLSLYVLFVLIESYKQSKMAEHPAVHAY